MCADPKRCKQLVNTVKGSASLAMKSQGASPAKGAKRTMTMLSPQAGEDVMRLATCG